MRSRLRLVPGQPKGPIGRLTPEEGRRLTSCMVKWRAIKRADAKAAAAERAADLERRIRKGGLAVLIVLAAQGWTTFGAVLVGQLAALGLIVWALWGASRMIREPYERVVDGWFRR